VDLTVGEQCLRHFTPTVSGAIGNFFPAPILRRHAGDSCSIAPTPSPLNCRACYCLPTCLSLRVFRRVERSFCRTARIDLWRSCRSCLLSALSSCVLIDIESTNCHAQFSPAYLHITEPVGDGHDIFASAPCTRQLDWLPRPSHLHTGNYPGPSAAALFHLQSSPTTTKPSRE